MWTVKVFTLYPELFPGPLASGLYKKALEKKIWSLETIDIRDSANDKHKTVDDTPFGGGSGMVIRPDILANSLDKNIINKKEPIIYLTPKGKKFDQKYSKKIAKKNINIICGHFEGIDERIIQTRNIEEVSIGDFILSGGEMAAFVIINSVVRLLPGVLGNTDSLYEESFEKDLLEYPQYTKPQKWEKKEVPGVLLTGNHKKIKDWRLAQSEDITRRRRPDLWKKYKKKNEKH
jgi:tRNA (guanine37-N1)-methyltransferase